jgi:NarL family two-component system response regulator LiaR
MQTPDTLVTPDAPVTPITVLIVDDHKLVRDGVRAYLEAQPDLQVVGEAATGENAVRLAAELVPDVALMDLVLGEAGGPGMDGVEATWRVRRVSPRTQVVVLTSFHDDTRIFSAIKAGALSYLLKDIGPDELVTAVRAAVRGEATLNPRVAARLVAEMRTAGSAGQPPNPFEELSGREQEVLRLIADGRPNAEIAAQLSLSEKTVKGHVSNILGKLHLADRTQAAVFAWREGLVRRE